MKLTKYRVTFYVNRKKYVWRNFSFRNLACARITANKAINNKFADGKNEITYATVTVIS